MRHPNDIARLLIARVSHSRGRSYPLPHAIRVRLDTPLNVRTDNTNVTPSVHFWYCGRSHSCRASSLLLFVGWISMVMPCVPTNIDRCPHDHSPQHNAIMSNLAYRANWKDDPRPTLRVTTMTMTMLLLLRTTLLPIRTRVSTPVNSLRQHTETSNPSVCHNNNKKHRRHPGRSSWMLSSLLLLLLLLLLDG